MILDFRIWDQTSAGSDFANRIFWTHDRPPKRPNKKLKKTTTLTSSHKNWIIPPPILGPRSEFPDWIHHFQTFFLKILHALNTNTLARLSFVKEEWPAWRTNDPKRCSTIKAFQVQRHVFVTYQVCLFYCRGGFKDHPIKGPYKNNLILWRTNECPLKINGWFRCISYIKVVRLFRGHALVFRGCIMARGWFQLFFIFTLGEDSHFDEHIFQLGWFNHQLAMFFFWWWFFHYQGKDEPITATRRKPLPEKQRKLRIGSLENPSIAEGSPGCDARLIPGLGQPGWGDALEVVICCAKRPYQVVDG